MGKLFKSRLHISVFLLLSISMIGVLGYRFIAQYSWIDSLYMTVITISTVGFREIGPMDDASKLFTIFLIITSLIVIAFFARTIVEYFLSKNSIEALKIRAMRKKIEKMKGHVIVCGLGRNGSQAVERLISYKRDYVVIENNQEKIDKHHLKDLTVIKGDAGDDQVLIEAGIHHANYLIAALADDASNLFLVLTARQLNPKLFIIARAEEYSTCSKLELAGASKVIMPSRIGGDQMASLVVTPDLITFMDKLATQGENMNLEELDLSYIESKDELKTLKELDLRRKFGCSVIGYVTPEGDYIINPDADLKLEYKGKIIVLGRAEQIESLNNKFNIKLSI
jgi:voltage-gated potassium channel